MQHLFSDSGPGERDQVLSLCLAAPPAAFCLHKLLGPNTHQAHASGDPGACCNYVCTRPQNCLGKPAPTQRQGAPEHPPACCYNILWSQFYTSPSPSGIYMHRSSKEVSVLQSSKLLHVPRCYKDLGSSPL
ncbi:uncharacterized protein LOC120837128 [Ixodes scapularis]|uniref:uncharacterized protein LOC120837128 n=1 Tax=Ixodes scapularis TaxID=6945 RepID=UPI001A9F22A5|nr:uncharacterized protein LOC120837128 [Ixodes scapularis]